MDRRDHIAMYGTPGTFDEKTMTVDFEFEDDETEVEPENQDEDHDERADGPPGRPGKVIEVPAHYEVCGTCNGKGRHVNPGVDAHGITAEEFDRDWSYEEREGYFRGDHDVTCVECKGRRVSPVMDLDKLSAEDRKRIRDYLDDRESYIRMCESERRMGA
jgi:hypothetical protein